MQELAHTIGQARCVVFRNRVYNESNIDASLCFPEIQLPERWGQGDNNLSPLDATTRVVFDNGYFKDLLNNKGVILRSAALRWWIH